MNAYYNHAIYRLTRTFNIHCTDYPKIVPHKPPFALLLMQSINKNEDYLPAHRFNNGFFRNRDSKYDDHSGMKEFKTKIYRIIAIQRHTHSFNEHYAVSLKRYESMRCIFTRCICPSTQFAMTIEAKHMHHNANAVNRLYRHSHAEIKRHTQHLIHC